MDTNKIVHEEISTNMSVSEKNEEMFQNEKYEAMQSERLSEGRHEAAFSDVKLEDEGEVIIVHEKGIPIEGENKCNEPNTSITLDTKKTENTINSCVMSTDVSNINQSASEENDEAIAFDHIPTNENMPDIIQETLQSSLEVVKCNMSNDINNVQKGYTNNEIIDQVTEINICNNKMQVNNLLAQKQECDRKSSLDIIATEYGDTDSDMEEMEVDSTTESEYIMSQMQTQNLQQYRTVEKNLSCEEIDSEDDSDSSSSSSSSSSNISISDNSSNSDSDDTTNIKKNESKANTTKKTKHVQNELDDLPPIEDLQISVPEVLCNPLGKIEKIVEQLVVIKPKPGEPTLNLDTVLFVNKGMKALGKIFDVFGSVSEPYYCVRFNDAKHIEDNDVKVGMQVYYCPSNTSYTSFVFLHELTKIKACDGVGDDEPPAFSDDEEEQAYYEMLKQKNNKDCPDGKTSQKKQYQTKSCFTPMGWNNPWSMNRNVQSQRNWKRQQNWRGGNRFNSAQNGPYSYNESWQQYPYQNNCWQPVPQNVYPMSNNSYAGYRMPYNGPQLPQHSSSSDGAHQYYQSTESNFRSNNIQSQYPRALFGASPRFNSPYPSVGTNCHQFSSTSYSYMNTSYPTQLPVPMTDANTYWSPPVPSSVPPSDTKDATITDQNSSK